VTPLFAAEGHIGHCRGRIMTIDAVTRLMAGLTGGERAQS
jgi:hypothetical protein